MGRVLMCKNKKIMKKIVTIGGGTGSFTLLSGLKKYTVDISAIVSMADDGGSTGRLRDELGVLPPGDVRQCLVALSDSSDTLRKLMSYRFPAQEGTFSSEGGSGIGGHNFGNLLLSALEKINNDFAKGLEGAAEILNIKGRVIPVSTQKMNLAIRLNNKKIIVGEKYLDHNEDVRKNGIKKVYLRPKVHAYELAIKAIKKADLIILGPGDHYGSIIPNLLVAGISEAICKSKATVIYNCNLTNKKGQTENFDVDKYAQEINKYLGEDRIDLVVCPSGKPNAELMAKYEEKEGKNSLVLFDEQSGTDRSYRIVKADVTRNVAVRKNKENKNDLNAEMRSFVRHDSDKLAKVMILLSERSEYKKMIKNIF